MWKGRDTAEQMGLISVYERYENPRQGKNIKTFMKILALTFNRLPCIFGWERCWWSKTFESKQLASSALLHIAESHGGHVTRNILHHALPMGSFTNACNEQTDMRGPGWDGLGPNAIPVQQIIQWVFVTCSFLVRPKPVPTFISHCPHPRCLKSTTSTYPSFMGQLMVD